MKHGLVSEEVAGTVGCDDAGDSQKWEPHWMVNIGHYCDVGIKTDDGFFVVLGQGWDGNWKPLNRIPSAAVQFRASLLIAGSVPLRD